MRIAAAAGLFVSAMTLAGCGGRAVEIDQDARPVAGRWNATLSTPAGLAGALQLTGAGWMGSADKDGAETEAQVSIANAAPGGRHPWHVHRGQCGSDLGILGAADAYTPLEVGGDGKADEKATLSIPLPRQGQYFVNVHASEANMRTIVACGNLAPPSQ